MINFLKKYFVLFFLSFLVVVLIFLKIFYGNTGVDKSNTTVIIPTQIPTVTVFEKELDSPESEDGEITVLPYKGKKMQITGYLKPGVLEVLVKKEEDKVEAEAEVKEWMKKNPSFKTNNFEFKIQQ